MTAALAVMPVHWVGHHRDIWALVTPTEVRWCIFDLATALGDEKTAAGLPSRHDASMPTWTIDLAAPYIRSQADTSALVAELLQWLEDRTEEVYQVGLTETIRLATRQEPITRPSGHPMPEYFSVHEAAAILDRDPAIDTGEQRLFHAMVRSGWVIRSGENYRCDSGAIRNGFLAIQPRKVPGREGAYPQVVITAAGIRAMHMRLGGQAAVQFVPPMSTPLEGVKP